MKLVRKAVILVLLLVVPLSGLLAAETADSLVAKAMKEIKSVSAAEAKKMIDAKSVVVLDVREPDEYAGEIIPGAINIPRGMLEFNIAAKIKDKGQAIVTYCLKGGRGALAAQTLQTLGYTKVYSLTGGISAWKAAAYPMEKGKK